MTKRSLIVQGAVVLSCFVAGCDFPYKPVVQTQPGVVIKPAALVGLHPINSGRQICNANASNDPVNFKACMLFLNLIGPMKLSFVDPVWAADYGPDAGEHDRLTIVDTGNVVRWYMKVGKDYISEDAIQKPRWSTHPDFISFNGEVDEANGYAIRISDKKVFKFNNGKFNGGSAAHIWVDPAVPSGAMLNVDPSAFPATVTYDSETGMADTTSIKSFFGTRNVKIVYSKVINTKFALYYTDYSEATPTERALAKPLQKEIYNCESAQISPDVKGDWIIYNCYKGVNDPVAYYQKLEPNSKPAALSNLPRSAEPRFFKDPETNELFAVYCNVFDAIDKDLGLEIADNSLGTTYIRSLNLNSAVTFNRLKEERVLIGMPFRGGITADGGFLCTGYQFGYIYHLSN